MGDVEHSPDTDTALLVAKHTHTHTHKHGTRRDIDKQTCTKVARLGCDGRTCLRDKGHPRKCTTKLGTRNERVNTNRTKMPSTPHPPIVLPLRLCCFPYYSSSSSPAFACIAFPHPLHCSHPPPPPPPQNRTTPRSLSLVLTTPSSISTSTIDTIRSMVAQDEICSCNRQQSALQGRRLKTRRRTTTTRLTGSGKCNEA